MEVIDQQNQAVLEWMPKVRRKLIASARWFSNGKTESMVLRNGGQQTERKLAASIGSLTRKASGEIISVSFQFERHGVFVHKGVGRGYRASGGGMVTRYAKSQSTNERVAVEWFNPIMESETPELADRIAEINADVAVNATRMIIK